MSDVALKLRDNDTRNNASHEQKPYEGASVPENYDRYLVPLIFEDYAADLAARLAIQGRKAILETACGTGAVTRHLAARLPEGTRLTATDLSPQMVDHTTRELGQRPELDFRQADALALPFPDESFDALVCQFGAMLYPDIGQGFREAARVLSPGSQYVFNVWDSLDRNGFSRCVHEAAARLYPDDPPRFLEAPYHYHDLTRIADDLHEAGFESVDISVQPRQSWAAEAKHVAWGLVAGSPLAGQVAERNTYSLEEAVEAVASAVAKEFGPGPVSAPMQALQISARLPLN